MDFLNSIKDFALPIVDNIPILRELLGILLVFFIPGFAWTFVFFKNNISKLERVILSVGLSIALVTLSVLAANAVLHIPFTGVNVLLIIVLITLIPVAVLYIIRRIRKKKQQNIDASSGDSQDLPQNSPSTSETASSNKKNLYL